jgi:outer membrane immunogenic protein
MFRKSLLSTAALLAIGGSAFAADLPSRAAPPVYMPPPPPIFTWTGFYVGGQVGYAWGNSGTTAASTATGATIGEPGYNPNGVIGGAHAGYNYQMSQFVIGLEADVNGSNYRGSGISNSGVFTNSTNIPVDGSIRGRVGFAWDRALFYGTGGVAFGSLQNNTVNTLTGASDSFDRFAVGWTAGGGVEYAVTNNWSIRAEYRYTDFGTNNQLLVNSTGGAVNLNKHETENRVQAGFSYKFGEPLAPPPPLPAVAKY